MKKYHLLNVKGRTTASKECKRKLKTQQAIIIKKKKKKLTCFATPKSASLTTPEKSTSKLAPLMSLLTHEKKKSKRHVKQINPKTTSMLKRRIEISHKC